ncbi:GHKL domain-containing protein [Emticicia agri]|uniref:histidine kinase n=2 Tax=Emticicia agri TaxID=2492393 RepID=A0A4Q5LZ65_9BACT|nr:GHKL domain-containing protein [Emticicia agri]
MYGVTLSNHWKWHAGDNPAWAKPEFNDSLWDKLQVAESIEEFPKLRESEIAWFRRPIQVTQALVNKPLSISVKQMGASEIYLDGKLLHKLGVVSKNDDEEQTKVSTTSLPIVLSDTNKHVLAVRYSFSKDNFYYPGTNSETFHLRVHRAQDVGKFFEEQANRTSGFFYFFTGIFLIFTILHFSFYASNRARKVSLSLGLTMLALTLAFFLRSIESYQTEISSKEVYGLLSVITTYAGVFLINVSLYQYLNQKFGIIFYVQALLVTISMFSYIFNWDMPYSVEAWLPFLLLFVDFIRVSILADRRKDSNAKVPIYSLLVVAGCALLSIIVLFIEGTTGNGSGSIIMNLGIFFIIIMFFSIPIGLSLSLVREYTRTHQALSKKLVEIEKLSAENLAYEQEKQQILAAQNEILEKEVAERTAELAQSLQELKVTQSQLIQSEKLASLGELTAGIAHEIQNPLNFVNNFSELSKELIEELKEEREKEKSKRDEELEEELLGDIAQNLEKINHHGKRASSIVKGMLEHSRTSSGKKEPTDVNAMADEYLRLAYHGIRAKDKSFNADFKAILDESIPMIQLITQDFGRVLLNLINNAFYAVKDMQGKGQVIVRTKKLTDSIEIRVSDNGTGIPEHIKAKIFQPFFTTKPTGQGTGLGLSLTYDIVTKSHNGSIEVETKEREGTMFIIKLPYL